MDSAKVESLTESIKIELKSRLNKEANNYGCEIDDVNVKILDENEVDRIEKINELSENLDNEQVVADYRLHDKKYFFIAPALIFAYAIVLFQIDIT